MRIVAFVAALCLILSPVAYAGDHVVPDVSPSNFFIEVWETVIAIPMMVLERITSTVSVEKDVVDPASSIEPPENDAGVMIIVNG